VNVKDGRAMDVSGNKDVEGQNVVVTKRHNALNQQWDVVYLDTLPAPLKEGEWWAEFGMYIGKEFSIVSKMACGRYLDVIGTNAVVKTRNASKSQKWVFDYTSRTIINVQTKKSLNFYNNQVDVRGTSSAWNQLFRYKNEMLVNVKGKVMQLDGNKCAEGSNVGVGAKASTRNQKWGIVYTDSEVELKTKGVSDFGFHIGRPFYIVTQMCSGRAIEVTSGRNLVLKRKQSAAQQHFFYDNATKTVKSM